MADKDTKTDQGDKKKKRAAKKGSGGSWSVIAIKNNIPRHPQHGYVDFIATEVMSEENILSRLKSIQDSKTGKGGVKDLADDIDDAEEMAGKDYSKYFEVKTAATDMSKEEAFNYKGKLASKARKVYNQAIIIRGKKK